jgi:hypothetical protein
MGPGVRAYFNSLGLPGYLPAPAFWVRFRK